MAINPNSYRPHPILGDFINKRRQANKPHSATKNAAAKKAGASKPQSATKNAAVKKAGASLKGRLFMGAMLLSPAIGAEDAYGAARAVALGGVGWAGFDLGVAAGARKFANTAAKGGILRKAGVGIAKFGMGMTGSFLLEAGAEAVIHTWEKGVERERDLRKLNWVQNTAAFDTQRAHTMRQASLEAMNRGMMSARSMLGREGAMLHQ